MAAIFPRFKKTSLQDWVHNPDDPNFPFIENYAKELEKARETGKGLTLIGPPGVGKTMLACAVLNAARAAGYKVKSLSLQDFVAMHHREFKLHPIVLAGGHDQYDDWSSTYQTLEGVRKDVDFVLFDDVGKEYNSGSGWSNAEFDRFIRFRWNFCLPTLLTSNSPLPIWCGRYSESMESLLHESSYILTFDYLDYRQRAE